jgi:hypothetical protein
MILEVMPEAAEQDGLHALRLGGLVEHPERPRQMPHFLTDDVADDRGHFGNAEQFRPSRPVALARMTCWIEERGDRNAGDIVDRGRGVTAFSCDWQRKDPEMRREWHHLHIGAVSEEAGIDDGVRDAWNRQIENIRNPWIGRNLFGILRAAGVTELSIEPWTRVIQGFELTNLVFNILSNVEELRTAGWNEAELSGWCDEYKKSEALAGLTLMICRR